MINYIVLLLNGTRHEKVARFALFTLIAHDFFIIRLF